MKKYYTQEEQKEGRKKQLRRYNMSPAGRLAAQKYHASEKWKQTRRTYRELSRKKVLEHYGNQCNYCGISDIDVLTIDHINNNRTLRRKDKLEPLNTAGLYLWLIKNGFPEGYQILCRNCNWKKEVERKKNAGSRYW